jgi:hypothetical protein
MNEQNNSRPDPAQQGLSSTDDRSAIPLGQQPPLAGSASQSPAGQQPLGDQPTGQQSQTQGEGAIPKAVEAIEKAADKGLEKTSGVVGNTIDKVADAAIGVLGGKPDHNNN